MVKLCFYRSKNTYAGVAAAVLIDIGTGGSGGTLNAGVGGAAAVGGSAATVGVLGTLHIHIDLSVLKTAAECSIRVEYTYCALAIRASAREAYASSGGVACHTTKVLGHLQ